jgi:hypothetical protein
MHICDDQWIIGQRESTLRKSFEMMGPLYGSKVANNYHHLCLQSQGKNHLGSEGLYQEQSHNNKLLPYQQLNELHCYTLPIA